MRKSKKEAARKTLTVLVGDVRRVLDDITDGRKDLRGTYYLEYYFNELDSTMEAFIRESLKTVSKENQYFVKASTSRGRVEEGGFVEVCRSLMETHLDEACSFRNNKLIIEIRPDFYYTRRSGETEYLISSEEYNQMTAPL